MCRRRFSGNTSAGFNNKDIGYSFYMASVDEPLLAAAAAHHTPEAQRQFKGKPPFESWGEHWFYDAKVIPLHWQADYPRVIDGVHSGALPVGWAAATATSACSRMARSSRPRA